MRAIWALLWAALCFPMGGAALVKTDSDRVLVVYNTAWVEDRDGDGVQDSEQIKNHYLARRSIPPEHVLGVAAQTQTDYRTHEQFYDELVGPISRRLEALGPTSVDAILLLYGIPYRTPGSSGSLSVDSCLTMLYHLDEHPPQPGFRTHLNPYRESTPTFGSDQGHFDHAKHSYAGAPMYLVSRLSAPDAPRGVINLIEQARYAELYLQAEQSPGVVYVDSRWGPYRAEELLADPDVRNGQYYSYEQGDKNIAFTQHYVAAGELGWENLGSDREIGESGAAYPSAPRALFYGGWYNYGRYLDAFEWLPGSAGCDLNSNSAQGMRDGSAWMGGAFQRGLSCAVGVVGEPYLDGHPRPNVFLYYLLRGHSFAEAASLATPYLAWQSVNVGDPLYAPFAPKAPSLDTTPPRWAPGYPALDAVGADRALLAFRIEESASEPEVVRCRIEYGTTPELGQVDASFKGYWVHNRVEWTSLPSGTTIWYRVVLEDPAGWSAASPIARFETLNAAPIARFSASAFTGSVPFSVEFDASNSSDADGSIVRWRWDFGDGTSAEGARVQHIYTQPDGVSASLTVFDDDGAQDSVAVPLRIEPSDGALYLVQGGLDGASGVADTYLSADRSSERSKNYGGAALTRIFGTARRALIRFELPWISEYETVVHAELRLTLSKKNYGAAEDALAIHALNEAWEEGRGEGATLGAGATWDDADRGAAWSVPGGTFDAEPIAQVPYAALVAPGRVAIDLTAQVAAWAHGAQGNHGLLLKPRDDNFLMEFHTREAADPAVRPLLLLVTSLQATDEGTPHGWLERWYPGASDQFEALSQSDTDGDGFSAWQEYLADTDPTSFSSRFRIESVRSNTVFFSSSSNRVYTLYGSDQLPATEWMVIAPPRRGVGGADSMIGLEDLPSEFFKMSVELP